MSKTKLMSTLGILVMLACLSCVQALDQSIIQSVSNLANLDAETSMGSSIFQSASNIADVDSSSTVNQQISQVAVSKYSDYYKMPLPSESSAKSHIEAPKKHEIKDNMPATVYFSYQMQAVPYTQYQKYAIYTGGNSLWIQGASSWSQYAQVPQGSSLSLLATTSTGGNGYLYEISPS